METRVAVITGANKGLGFALVRALCRLWGEEGRVILAARDPGRGRKALETLEREGLHPLLRTLDLADPGSAAALAGQVQREFGSLDLLIQNGAYAPGPEAPAKEQVRPMIETNNLGTHRVLRAFRPLLRPQARVLVVASGFGTLKSLDPSLHGRFDTDRMDLDALERVLLDYTLAVEEGRAAGEGWPEWINIPSKVGQVAAARIFARELAAQASEVLVNAVCPGWMITDASRPYLKSLPPEITPKQPDEAAGDVLWAGLLPPRTRHPHGELVQYRKLLPWT